ncbi:uncharacterized protein LOC141677103 isoform X8 [Apium graveolens]|uniref:uncharacterized protein LOC141677103 isoform X8 n=1 Tax=Apium graveolens TaxID=4045 RepID=UPI003D7B5A0F
MEGERDYREELENETPAPSETVASNPRKRKPMESRSNLWDHYQKIRDEQGNLIKEIPATTSRIQEADCELFLAEQEEKN